MIGADLRRIHKERKESRPAKVLLEDIKNRNYVGVMRKLVEGTSANIDYYGVVPLMVAVANGVRSCQSALHRAAAIRRAARSSRIAPPPSRTDELLDVSPGRQPRLHRVADAVERRPG